MNSSPFAIKPDQTIMRDGDLPDHLFGIRPTSYFVRSGPYLRKMSWGLSYTIDEASAVGRPVIRRGQEVAGEQDRTRSGSRMPVHSQRSSSQRPVDLPLSLHRDHSRQFEQNHYVYPVLSRRSRGISVGINLNPDKVCNFDCVYCQVDRRTPVPPIVEVDEQRLLWELDATLTLVLSGQLYQEPRFASVPGPLRRLNDIAFSGDGEPTTYPRFAQIVQDVAAVKAGRKLEDIKLVLITNATMLHRPNVQAAMATFDASNGEIWAKLDAGTEAYYRLIEPDHDSVAADSRQHSRHGPSQARGDPEPLAVAARSGTSGSRG